MPEKRSDRVIVKRKTYPADLTDAEWDILRPMIPDAKPSGRPRSADTRKVVNAIFYVLKGRIP